MARFKIIYNKGAAKPEEELDADAYHEENGWFVFQGTRSGQVVSVLRIRAESVARIES